MLNKSFAFSIFILVIAIGSVAAISTRGEPTVVATNLENLPMVIDGYKAVEDFFAQAVYDELNADWHVYRHYRKPDINQVDLYIGYYGTAKGGRTPHNPYGCLPGAGWGVVKTNRITIQVPYHKNGVDVNYVLAQKGEMFETVLHWYQSAGTKVLDSGFQQNIQRFLGRVLQNKNDGAFVRVSTLVAESEITGANKQIKKFAEDVLNLLPEYWPEER